MKKLKCEFGASEMLLMLDALRDSIQSMSNRRPHELSEVIVYRLFILIALERKFRSRSQFMHPTDTCKMSFDIKDVLALKNSLMNKMRTPGLANVFMKLDKYIHPAIQLEL